MVTFKKLQATKVSISTNFNKKLIIQVVNLTDNIFIKFPFF